MKTDLTAFANIVLDADDAFVNPWSESESSTVLNLPDIQRSVKVYIASRADLADLSLRRHESAGGSVSSAFWVVLQDDPVVDFLVPKRSGQTGALMNTRLPYFRNALKESQFVVKGEAFLSFADNLFHVTKKWLTRAEGHACGPHLACVLLGGTKLERRV